MNNTAPTVTALITARALVASLEAASLANPTRSASYAVSAARAAATKCALAAVAAGEVPAVFETLDAFEAVRLRIALKKTGMLNDYYKAVNEYLPILRAARAARAAAAAAAQK
jgi:hypothetical protein